MKTLKDLFGLIEQAVKIDAERESLNLEGVRGRWFIDFSGHVGVITIRHYKFGWKPDGNFERCEVKLTDAGIQEAYWFIHNRI